MLRSGSQDAKAADTREALIVAGLKLFGELGFDGTSTRAIANEAKVNAAMIAYYFGSKEGLRQACAEWIVSSIEAVAGSVPVPPPDELTPEVAIAAMEQTLRAMVSFVIAGDGARPFVGFMMREVLQPSRTLDHIYDGVIRPVHKRMCVLWGAATGSDPESPRTRLAVFTMFGQMLYFRIGREIVVKRMGWDGIAVGEANQIGDVLVANLRAIVNDARQQENQP